MPSLFALVLLAGLAGSERWHGSLDPAVSPRVGGICKTCPDFDYGTFTPTAVTQVHDGSLTGRADCAWYAFDVVAGETYLFSTCPLEGGAASWDTILEVYDPSQCGTWLARNDQGCTGVTGPSTVRWDASSTGTVHVKVRGFSGATLTGPFRLAYRSLGVVCESCTVPSPTDLGVVGSACTCVSSSTDQLCRSRHYRVLLEAGATYELTTCPSACGGATAGFDTLLRLRAPGCAAVATNDDACATSGFTTRSTLSYTAATTGVHVIEVTGRVFAGGMTATGAFTLCARRTGGCPGPAVTLLPASGPTTGLGCSRTEDFTVESGPLAILPVAYAWSIAPPAGGAALPSSGFVTSSAPLGAATFRSRLTGRGTHVVTIAAGNACGTAVTTHPYVLQDLRAPTVLAPPAPLPAECPDPPGPAGAPQVRDNCDLTPDVVMTEQALPGPCPAAYAVRRTWTATDDAGNVSPGAVHVARVDDTTGPFVTPDLTVAHCVFPPDDGRACFTFADFTPQAVDACGGALQWHFVNVTHSEAPLGACDPPDDEPDVEVAPDGTSFCVRAERCVDDPTLSDGRLYLVEVVAVDACGNASPLTAIATILVPQDSADTGSCRVPVPW